jgi:hypothetical protein
MSNLLRSLLDTCIRYFHLSLFVLSRRKNFVNGWVEFADKKIARSVAESLNNTAIGWSCLFLLPSIGLCSPQRFLSEHERQVLLDLRRKCDAPSERVGTLATVLTRSFDPKGVPIFQFTSPAQLNLTPKFFYALQQFHAMLLCEFREMCLGKGLILRACLSISCVSNLETKWNV